MSEHDDIEGYSAEDMLKVARAKSGGDQSGESETREVVVQDDGSKVVRVRKRVRKNKSATDELLSSEEEEKSFHLKLLLWFVIGLVLLAALIAGLLFFKTLSYNNTSEIGKVHEGIEESMDADVTLRGYRVGVNQANIGDFTANSRPDSRSEYSLQLREIQIPLKPELVLLGRLEGESARAQTGVLKVAKASFLPEVSPLSPIKLPFGHQGLHVENMNFAWGDSPRMKDHIKISGVESKFAYRSGNVIQMIFRGGAITNSGTFPPFLNNAVILMEQQKITVQSLNFGDGEVGEVTLTGEYVKGGEDEQEMGLQIEKVKLENINPVLKGILEARISSNPDKKGSISINPKANEFKISADFQASDSGFYMQYLPFLDYIYNEIGGLSSAAVSFNRLSQAKLEVTKDGYHFKDVNFESIAKLALRGEFSIALDGALGGELEVGLKLSKLKEYYPKLTGENTTTNRGYVWIPFTLTGTVENPKDNFSKVVRDTFSDYR